MPDTENGTKSCFPKKIGNQIFSSRFYRFKSIGWHQIGYLGGKNKLFKQRSEKNVKKLINMSMSGITVISQKFLEKGNYEYRRFPNDFSVSLNHLKTNKWQVALLAHLLSPSSRT